MRSHIFDCRPSKGKEKVDCTHEKDNMMAEKFDAMVCTVGENPLPVYLGIAQLTTDNAKIVLLHSEQTRGQAQRIALCVGNLPRDQRDVRFHDSETGVNKNCLIDDPWDFESVREKFKILYHPNFVLNISGGTNIMTSTGYHVWKSHQEKVPIVYLEENKQRFRFDDGTKSDIDLKMDIDTLSRLHGTDSLMKATNTPANANNHLEDLFNLFSVGKLAEVTKKIPSNAKTTIQYFDRPYTSPMLDWLHGCDTQRKYPFKRIRNNKKRGIEEWAEITTNVLGFWEQNPMEIENILPSPENWKKFVYDSKPNKGILKNEIGKQINFTVGGFWFERLVMNTIIENLENDYKVSRAKSFEINQQEFEVDGLCIANHRLYVISITTDKKPGVIKEKAFEAMRRAQQLGGGLACSIVISPCEKELAQDCQNAIDSTMRHIVMPADMNGIDISSWKKTLTDDFKLIVERKI